MPDPRTALGTLAGFTRLRICVLTAFLGPAGFLLSGGEGPALLTVYAASLLLCMGIYSHNNMTDHEEDRINRGAPAVIRKRDGGILVSSLYAAGLLVSLLSPAVSFLPAALFALMGIAYNAVRIKRLTLLKNAYTSLGISLVFLMGVPQLAPSVLQYQAVVFLTFLSGSVMSDLRDAEGDGKAGIRTLPVVLGEKRTRMLLLALMAATFVMIVLSPRFLALLPFELASAALLVRERTEAAHALGGLSMPFLAFSLLFF